MTETFTLYKLMVLYLLKKVDFPLATTQISDFMLGKEYTTYFRLQETLSKLVDSNMIQAENTYRRTLYHLTGDGEKTITRSGGISMPLSRKMNLT